jgi:hypothetical protein
MPAEHRKELTQRTGLGDETIGACVTGELRDGASFQGCDRSSPRKHGYASTSRGSSQRIGLPAFMSVTTSDR